MPPSALVGCFWDKGYPAAFKNKSALKPCDLPDAKCGGCPKEVEEWAVLWAAGEAEDERAGDVANKAECAGMTLEKCNGMCKGHTYFAVQNGGTGCFCGGSYGKYGPAPDVNCTLPCKGDEREQCGGPGANAVYRAQ